MTDQIELAVLQRNERRFAGEIYVNENVTSQLVEPAHPA